jgi:L-threonylcarbamoyladenylate synthase
MPTLRLRGDDPRDVERAAELLALGKLVAIPTETVYGLAADALDVDAVRAIFAAKGRPQDNPLIAHVRSLDDATPLWSAVDERIRILARELWPGPLTIVSWRSVAVPDVLTASLPKVAVRAPDHDVTRELLKVFGRPLAAPSANLSGRPSPTTAADVLSTLDGKIDAVLDGGACRVGIESTVVDVTGEVARILRPGAIGADELREVLGDVETRAPGPAHVDEASPGLRHRHYAPAIAHVRIEDPAPHWNSDAAILARSSRGSRLAPTEILPDTPAEFARELYAALYRLERARPQMLVIEPVPDDDKWLAVKDRLTRMS